MKTLFLIPFLMLTGCASLLGPNLEANYHRSRATDRYTYHKDTDQGKMWEKHRAGQSEADRKMYDKAVADPDLEVIILQEKRPQ